MNSKGKAAVVHVSSAHPYTDNRIHYRECRSLVEAGFAVTLVATESPINGTPTGVDVVLLPRRRRIARMIASGYQAFRLALRSRAKIVHLHDPELIPYIPLLRLAGRTVIYDAHEDLPVQVLDKPYVNRWTRGPLALATRAILRVASGADLVVAATETVARRFPPKKTILVRNYPPLRDEEDDLPAASGRRNIAVYIGALSRSRGIEEIIAATMDPAFPDDWSLHLAGPVSEDAAALIAATATSDRVVYHGQLAPVAARDLLLTAKVGLVTLHNTPAYRDALPTKMFEYFAAGVPAIASDFPLWRDIVESAGGGVLVDERDPEQIARAVRTYADSPQMWDAHSRNARRAAEESLNWAPEASALVKAYAKLEAE